MKNARCWATIKTHAQVKVESATLKVLFQQQIFFSKYLQQKAFNKITVPNDSVEFVLVEIINSLITKHKLVVTQKLPTSFTLVCFFFNKWGRGWENCIQATEISGKKWHYNCIIRKYNVLNMPTFI